MADNQKLLDFLARYHGTVGGNGDNPFYAPQHDLTNLGVICIEEMKEDIFAMEKCKFVKDWMEKFNISNDEIYSAYAKFLQSNMRIVGKDKDLTIAEAVKRTGYDSVRLEVKGLIDALYGRAMQAAYWYSLRDTCTSSRGPHYWTRYNTLENLFKEVLNAMEGDESNNGKKVLENEKD